MERLYKKANKEQWNKRIPWNINVQIANVSNHLKKLAKECCQYSNNHLQTFAKGCKMLKSWHKGVRNTGMMDVFKKDKGQPTF